MDLIAAAGLGLALTVTPVPLPGGGAGVGFDDLGFSSRLGRVLVPAGRSGALDLIDPATRKIESIGGFSAADSFTGGHGEGVTSVDEGRGLLFAVDRTARQLVVVDPGSRKVLAKAPLAGGPDYVRFVEPTGEVWVTEPEDERIEVFTLPAGSAGAPVHAAFIAVKGGPESLVIDAARGRAYSNFWKSTTVAIDLRKRTVVENWPNGCEGSRGLALDSKRGFLFIGCAEGKAVTLGLERGGAVLGSISSGSGVDIISFNPALSHLYLPGGKSATAAILGVSAAGALTLLDTVKTAAGAHCVVTDDRGQAWICDPSHGQLLLVQDSLPSVR